MLAHEAWLGAARRRRAGARRASCACTSSREPSAFYAVFDWHAGRTLEQLLRERQRSPSPRSWPPRPRSRARWAGCTATASSIATSSRPTCTGRRRPLAHPRPRRGAVGPRAAAQRDAARRHAELHEPRAVGRRAGARPDARQRPLRARRHAVPVADRPAAVRRDRALPARAATGATRRAVALRPDVPIWLDHVVLQGGRARPARSASRPPRNCCWRSSAARRGRWRRRADAAGAARPGGAVEARARRVAAAERAADVLAAVPAQCAAWLPLRLPS